MKRILTSLAATLPLLLSAQDLPQPSPKGRVDQVVGLTNVSIEYSRPSVKGRAVFGDLVPYGKLWRLGANGCTVMSFDGPVVIEDVKVPAGKYSLFAEPNEGAWVFHLNKNTALWGTDGFKPEEDVAVWKAVASTADGVFTETLTFGFDEVKDDKARIDVRWEKTRASFTLTADATEKALANIKEAMAQKDIKASSYNRCARYCVDKGIMLKEAQDWAQKAAKMDPKYWVLHTLALAQAANGDYAAAMNSAKESMAMAEKDGDTAYVRMNEEKIKEWSAK